MKGVSLSHLTRLSVKSIKRFVQYLQDGLPAKLKAIHILNVVPFFDKILSIMKPFMKADILNMVNSSDLGVFNFLFFNFLILS